MTDTLTIVAQYLHPQGKAIDVYSNGALSVTKNGKKSTSSATAEKLAAGHGGWVRVSGNATAVAATAAVIALPASKATPSVVLAPMRVKETSVANVGAFITDDTQVFQQKADGLRAMLVASPGAAFWFRNSSGGVLASAVGAATAGPILASLSPLPESATGYAVDGEIMDGLFYAFDFITDGGESTPLRDRLADLTAWYATVETLGLTDRIRLLPTAYTDTDKAALWKAVKEQGAEGVITKTIDGPYNYGARVTHSLKLKLTHTVDAVVVGRNVGADCNYVLALHDETGTLVNVGTVSGIGRGDIPADGTVVVEVKTLYAGAGGKLVQPSILRVRPDRTPESCTTDQMRLADRRVVSLASA